MKAWMSVSAAVCESMGRRRAMLRRWKKAVLVTWLTWGWKEVKDDTKVVDLGGWGESGAINSEGEVLTGAGE